MTEFLEPSFKDIHDGLNRPSGGTLGYELSVRSLNVAYKSMDSEETLLFLDTFLYKMVSILLDQNPFRIGSTYVKCVDESLSIALDIILWDFKAQPGRFMGVLTMLLDADASYYTGPRTLRRSLISKFDSAGGYQVMSELLAVSDTSGADGAYWAGCGNYAVIVEALSQLVDRGALDRARGTADVGAVAEAMDTTVDSGAAQLAEQELLAVAVSNAVSFLSALMLKLDSFLEADLKKESSESMKKLIDAMWCVFPLTIADEQCHFRSVAASSTGVESAGNSAVATVLAFQQSLQVFWCSNTLKLLRCQSIILRLFGWEQLQDMVQVAIATRPCAAAYMVCNAGVPVVNGLYEYAGQNVNDDTSPKYEKQPGASNNTDDANAGAGAGGEGVAAQPLLTLFRCNMKDLSQKWWFLSEADRDHPGAEKDVDYYNRKPTVGAAYGQLSADDREPPASGWLLAHCSPACEPHPTMHRVGAHIPEGVSADFYFLNKITAWVRREDIIRRIFDLSSLHREVIGRNSKLILLMVEMQLLTAEDLRLMWRSALATPDSDCMEEIYSLFAHMSALMPAEAFDSLLVRGLFVAEVETELKQYYGSLEGAAGEDGGSSKLTGVKQAALASASHFLSRIAALLDKYFDQTVLVQLSVQHVRCLFQAVWLVFKFPMLESVKWHKSIKQLLSKCIDPCPRFNYPPVLVAQPHVRSQAAAANLRLRRKQYLSERNQLILEIVTECGQVLVRGHTALSASASGLAPAKEAEIGRVVQVLQFLLEEHVTKEMVEILSCQEFPQLLLNEIMRFMAVHAQMRRLVTCGGISASDAYGAGLAQRVLLIRLYYSICNHINVPRATVDQLWHLMGGDSTNSACADNAQFRQDIARCERNILFSFLGQFVPEKGASSGPSSGSSSPGGVYNANSNLMDVVGAGSGVVYSPTVTCDRSDSLHIYTTMLCNPGLDWTGCGKEGFECFKAYFDYFSGDSAELAGFQILSSGMDVEEEDRNLASASAAEGSSVTAAGLAALWRILFHISCEDSAKRAMLLLLQTYNQPELSAGGVAEEDEGICSQTALLNKLFAQLGRISAMHCSASLTQTDCVCLRRCIATLQYAIANSAQRPPADIPTGSPLAPLSGAGAAHAVRGCMSRIRLTVRYRSLHATPSLYSLLYANHTKGENCVSYDINFAMKKRTVKGSEGSVTLSFMHPLHTLHDLKVQVGQAMRCTDYNRMLVLRTDDFHAALMAPILYGHGTELLTHGITEDCRLTVVFLVDPPTPAAFATGASNPFRTGSAMTGTYGSYTPMVYATPVYPEDDTADGDACSSNKKLWQMNTLYPHFQRLGSAVVDNDGYFNCLLSLQSLLLSVDASSDGSSMSDEVLRGCGGVLSSIWRLLIGMPSKVDVVESILRAVGIGSSTFGVGAPSGDGSLGSETGEREPSVDDIDVFELLEQNPVYYTNDGAAAVDWEAILGHSCGESSTAMQDRASSAMFCLYKLQIVSHLLQPGRDLAMRPGRKYSPQRYLPVLFQKRFVETGGFDFLLRTFTAGELVSSRAEAGDALSTSAATGGLSVSVTVQDVRQQCHKLSLETILHSMHYILFQNVPASRDRGPWRSAAGNVDDDSDTSSSSSLSSGSDSEDDQDESDANVAAVIDSCVVEKQRDQSVYMLSRIQDHNSAFIAAVEGGRSPSAGTGTTIVMRLLDVAGVAAGSAHGHSVVRDALALLSFLLDLKNVTEHLTSNAASKVRLGQVFKSVSKCTRGLVSAFTARLGRSAASSSVVFGWLLWIVESLTDKDEHCVPELFAALKSLLLEDSSSDEASASMAADRRDLALMISNRLDALVVGNEGSLAECNQEILLGYFQLLHSLIVADESAVGTVPLLRGARLVKLLMNEFLFPEPDTSRGSWLKQPLCKSAETRQAAFGVMLVHINSAPGGAREALVLLVRTEIARLLRCGGASDGLVRAIQCEWSMELSAEMKTVLSAPVAGAGSASATASEPAVAFTGLKNHGCTCYLNSLIQQLFMDVNFREALLRTPILDIHRTRVWHKADRELVGLTVQIECQQRVPTASGEEDVELTWRAARIVEYLATQDRHVVQYVSVDAARQAVVVDETVSFNIREGRPGMETGRVKIVPADGSSSSVPVLTSSEEASYRVLEELQRVFMFLLHSKRRFFDPKPFVEACSSLNMTFNVFQQNDASEFCDQLLDRLETAMRGKHTGVDIWNKVVNQSVFGGKTVTQKVPLECPAFSAGKKTECGQWNGTQEEDFINIKMIIRGKERVEDTFSDMIRGELFDGDNKIMCDICGEKKAVNRRQVLAKLPNTLVMHLKRFDMDFTTFEIVKLNNRISFDMRVNVMQYTREGLEVEEAAVGVHQRGQAAGKDADGDGDGRPAEALADVAPSVAATAALDPANYDYKLRGILVHMGTTQGGHYYSFISSPGSEAGGDGGAKWFRFDDDEVTPFDPADIPAQCFGGPMEGSGGGSRYSGGMEDRQRSSNALMLFYSRTDPGDAIALVEEAIAQVHADSAKVAAAEGTGVAQSALHLQPMADGYKAFAPEVWAANRRDLYLSYVLDQSLHLFVKDLMDSCCTKPTGAAVVRAEEIAGRDALPMFQFGCALLFDVILHSKERTELQLWVDALKRLITATAGGAADDFSSSAAAWFLDRVLDPVNCAWMEDYLLRCPDAQARASFVQILAHCMVTLAPDLAVSLPYGENPTLIDELVRLSGLQRVRLAELVLNQNINAMVVTIIVTVSEFLVCSASQLKVAGDILALISDIAEVSLYGQLFMECRIIAKLMMFVNPDCCDASIVALFANVTMTAKSRQDLQMLKRDVFETIAAVLCVPQTKKVPLLENQVVDRTAVVEGGGGRGDANRSLSMMSLRRSWDPELSAPVKEVLTTIFWEVCSSTTHSPTHGMDVHDFMLYMDKVVGPAGGRPSHAQIRQMFDRYDTTSDGKLTLRGFLGYHHSMALRNPKSVWKDMHAFGFENDLSRESTALSDTSINDTARSLQKYHRTMLQGMDEDGMPSPGRLSRNQSTAASDASSFPLSDETKELLSEIGFYEAGLAVAEHATLALARRVCVQHVDVSILLIQKVCQRIYFLTSSNDRTNQVAVLFNLLSHLVMALDTANGMSHLETRLEELFFGDYGFMSICLEESSNPNRRCECNRYDGNQLARRYFEFVKDFLENMAFMDLYMRNKIDQWTQQQRLFEEYAQMRRAARAQQGREGSGSESEEEDESQAYINAVKTVYANICRERERDAANSTPPQLSVPVSMDAIRAKAAAAEAAGSGSGIATFSPDLTSTVASVDRVVGAMSNVELGRFNESMRSDDEASYGDSGDAHVNSQASQLFNAFTIYVDGAGADEVNGIYVFYRMIDNVASFVKHIHEEDVTDPNRDIADRYCIYRCPMRDATDPHQWFISAPPKNELPGSSDDVDYYYAVETPHTLLGKEDEGGGAPEYGGRRGRAGNNSLYDFFMPPRNTWESCSVDKDPAPFIMFISSLNNSAANSVANTPNRGLSSNQSMSNASSASISRNNSSVNQGISYHYSPISPVPAVPPRKPPLSRGNSNPGSQTHLNPLSLHEGAFDSVGVGIGAQGGSLYSGISPQLDLDLTEELVEYDIRSSSNPLGLDGFDGSDSDTDDMSRIGCDGGSDSDGGSSVAVHAAPDSEFEDI